MTTQSMTFLATASLFLAASAFAGGSSSAGSANPASARCAELGAQVSILKDAAGNEDGFCQFDRAVIEEWTLYHATYGTDTLATRAFLEHMAPALTPMNSACRGSLYCADPSAVYCAQVGGTIVIWNSNDGQAGMCQFSDGSTIEGWTLYLGPAIQGYTSLATALRDLQ